MRTSNSLRLCLIFLGSLNYAFADLPPHPPSLEVKPATLADAEFYNVLIRMSRCTTMEKPQCTMRVYTPQQLLYYLQNCNLLRKWNINYYPNQQNLLISITATTKAFCLITIRDTGANTKQQCQLSKANIKQISKTSAINDFLKGFDNTAEYSKSFRDNTLTEFNTCLTYRPE